MSMKHKKIEEYITKFPIYQYAFIKPKSVKFSDRVRTICKKECPRYGRSWSCPPAVGSVAKCKEKCLSYSDALFFSSVAEVSDVYNMEEVLKTRREHEEYTVQIEEFLRQQGCLVYTLSTESCSICEKCAYPRKPCMHPEQMHPCIESHGILVTKTIEDNKMDYYMGEKILLWYTMMFFVEHK